MSCSAEQESESPWRPIRFPESGQLCAASLIPPKLTVEHNNANIIAMGARVVGPELAKMIVDEFFGATFQGGRHAERVAMISDIEKKYGAVWHE